MSDLQLFSAKMQLRILKYRVKALKEVLEEKKSEYEDLENDIEKMAQEILEKIEKIKLMLKTKKKNQCSSKEKIGIEEMKKAKILAETNKQVEGDCTTEEKCIFEPNFKTRVSGLNHAKFSALFSAHPSVHQVKPQVQQPRQVTSTSLQHQRCKDNATDRILFVGGLNPKTGETSLKSYFSKWGHLSEVSIKEDMKSWRYAHVRFSKLSHGSPLDQKKHVIDGYLVRLDRSNRGNKTEPQDKTARNDCKTTTNLVGCSGKTNCLIFHGKMQQLTEGKIKDHFSQFGTVIQIRRPKDHGGAFKHFAFVVYDDVDSLNKALKQALQTINGSLFEVQRAKTEYNKV